MKKQLLAGAFVLASFLTAQSQTLLNNTFGTDQATFTAALTGWSINEFDTDEDSWTGYNDADFQAAGFTGVVLASQSFVNNGTDTAPDLAPIQPSNYLLSPLTAIPASQPASLRFKTMNFGAEDAIESYVVWALTEEQLNDETLDLNDVEPATFGDAPNTGATTIFADMAAYAGQSVALLFLHSGNSEGIGYLLLDDIVLTSGAAGTEEIVLSSLSVYPNPSNGLVTIANNDNILVNGVTVADINGRTVKTAKFAGVAEANVNISDLSNGVYMMTISSDKGSVTKKIVKN